MTPPPAPEAHSPYHEGDLIFVMTTPPERTNKLTPRWKGPFEVKRVPNAYQVTYEDGMVWRTVHVNHAKPAKAPPGDFPVPTAPAASAISPPKYSSRNLSWRKPPPPQPAAPVAEPSQPRATAHPASPSLSRPTTRSSANQETAPLPEQRSPPTQPRANENSRSGPPLRRSERLKAANRPTDRPTQAAPAHSQPSINRARTFPYSPLVRRLHWG